MKNLKILLLGAATLMVALVLNFRHALNDYGVVDNKLHVIVMAQSYWSNGLGFKTTDDCEDKIVRDKMTIYVTVCDRDTDWQYYKETGCMCGMARLDYACTFDNW